MTATTLRLDDLIDVEGSTPSGSDLMITSAYLDVNPKQFPSSESVVKSLDELKHLAHLEQERLQSTLSHEQRESLTSDVAAIDDYVRQHFKRTNAAGLAMFSASGNGFWHVAESATPLATRAVISPHPYLAPLVMRLVREKPVAVLLTDRQKARIFLLNGETLTEVKRFEDFVPHRSAQGGWSQMRYQRHSDHWAKHHIDHAARLVFELERREPIRWIILGIDPEIEQDLEHDLHPYVKERIVARIRVGINAPEAEIAERARTARDGAEDSLLDQLVERINDNLGPGGRATAGVADTVFAINEKRVHILVVQDGLALPGAECTQCGMLLAADASGGLPETCPACGGELRKLGNVIEEVIQRSILEHVQIEVATSQGQLDPIGSIGALLYY